MSNDEATYEVLVERDIMLAMRDGVRLATDLHRPAHAGEAVSGAFPVLLMCGWWDPYAQTTTDNYLRISRRERGVARMVLGPWTHGERSVTFAGDVDFGPEATFDGNVAESYLALPSPGSIVG
ncbi:MAG: CocE/NonD family hydrolase [Burkholderiales bacterium]